jgi:hypothetical protein
MATLNLSNQSVDFDRIRDQLNVALSSKEAWVGTLATQTGETLIEFIAAIGALTQAKLLRYHQDSFPFTALSDEAIYALAAMQGVRLNRRMPMSVSVSLSSAEQVVLPEYTQFEINGTKFFSREPLSVYPTASQFTLYEGELITHTTKGLGLDYQIFGSTETDFQVSDVDVIVRINGNVIKRTQGGGWTLKGQQGCRDRTLPNGRMILEFGNDQFGTKPGVNDTLGVTYVVTKGLDASSIKITGKKVRCSTYPSIIGEAVSSLSGGANERDSELYKRISAPAFGTFDSAVTKQQHLNIVQSYPGVLDGTTFAQREVNPYAKDWMNLVKVVVLTSSPWSLTDRQDFLKYLNNNSMYSTRFFLEEPQPIQVIIQVLIFCLPAANLDQCRFDAASALVNLFKAKPGILGRDIYRSDIIQAIQSSNSNIEYVVLEIPSADLLVSSRAMQKPLLSLVANSSSTLAAGYYMYGVSPVFADNTEIAPLNYEWITVPTSNAYSIRLTWPTLYNAAQYKVWGRKESELGLVAQLVGVSSNTYIDNGWTNVVAGVPATSTVPVRYLTLGNTPPIIKAFYSTRSANRSNRQ